MTGEGAGQAHERKVYGSDWDVDQLVDSEREIASHSKVAAADGVARDFWSATIGEIIHERLKVIM